MTAILTNRITPAQFVDKWRPVTLTERSAAHSHFLDLCQMFDHPTPIEMDPTGQEFTFEKGVHKTGGGEGFADVWKRGYFAWEYKKRKKNLDDALRQLSRYASALENPPLQIVCDTERFQIVTAYTNSAPKSYDIALVDLLDSKKRGWLEAAFFDPKKLQPGKSRNELTRAAADKFSTLAARLQSKGFGVEDVGHFINRLVFLLFAEDVSILKDGFFRRTISELAGRPSDAQDLLTGLFNTFKTGGRFGLDRLPWINGGLFDDREALPLDEHEVGLLKAAGSQDWAHIDPTIFGTLFERFLDPDKRAQIGAHYTDAGKIGQIIEPVVLRPLRDEWRAVRADIEALVKKASAKGAKSKDWQRAEERRSAFLERLRTLSILDPACGSGNFLYLALHGVKDLEHAANQECESMGLPPRMPMVGPEILRGIEINPLAAELARTTIWIGDIQWAIQNGIRSRPEPILRRLDGIECRDALLEKTGDVYKWPKSDFIVGNPPFLGDKLMRRKLGNSYVDILRAAYEGDVPGNCDFVMYWIQKGISNIRDGSSLSCGFVATNSIKQKNNRYVVEKNCEFVGMSDVWSELEWVNEGAAVNVSIICFKQLSAIKVCFLDGVVVEKIHSDLNAGSSKERFDYTSVKELGENKGYSYFGLCLAGEFTIPEATAKNWLKNSNPKKKLNSDVIRPLVSGKDLVGRDRKNWVIDFGHEMSEDIACLYEKPFSYVEKNVKPFRVENNRESRSVYWWRHGETRPGMRKAIAGLSQYICTPERSKHRFFVMMNVCKAPEHRLVVFPFESFAALGILSSSFHRAWSAKLGSTLVDRPGYNTKVCFNTFPFPFEMTPAELRSDLHLPKKAMLIASTAKDLHQLREDWLNPDDPSVKVSDLTMTKLYNNAPTWLVKAHERLDRAVAAAYGWPEDISTEDALARLLELNRERAAAHGKT